MKKQQVFYVFIGIIILIIIVTIVACGAKAVKQSEDEIKEIDKFISEYTSEAPPESTTIDQEESSREIPTEATKAETKVTEVTTEATEPSKSIEELAEEAMDGKYGNGEYRKKALGENYPEVQSLVDEWYAEDEAEYWEDEYEYWEEDDEWYYEDYDYPEGSVLTPDAGVNDYYGITETYYNMDMSGVVEWMHSLGYGGEYWIRSDGVKMLGDYIMVAADYDWMPKGSIVETSLGAGIVCDTGLGGWYWYDIAVDW